MRRCLPISVHSAESHLHEGGEDARTPGNLNQINRLRTKPLADSASHIQHGGSTKRCVALSRVWASPILPQTRFTSAEPLLRRPRPSALTFTDALLTSHWKSGLFCILAAHRGLRPHKLPPQNQFNSTSRHTVAPNRCRRTSHLHQARGATHLRLTGRATVDAASSLPADPLYAAVSNSVGRCPLERSHGRFRSVSSRQCCVRSMI